MPTLEKLTTGQRLSLAALGVPALGMTFTVTVVSTYVPVLVQQVTGPVVVGISDRRSRRLRDRMPLLVACAAVTALAVAAVGLLAVLGTLSLWALALALAVLYAGYYAFLAPYWSLFPAPRRGSSARPRWLPACRCCGGCGTTTGCERADRGSTPPDIARGADRNCAGRACRPGQVGAGQGGADQVRA